MISLLAILQVKAVKAMINKSYRRSTWYHFSVRHCLSSFKSFSSCSISNLGMIRQRSYCDLFSWLKWVFISVNATLRNNKYIDLCQYCFTVSEEMLFGIIYCPWYRGYFSFVPNLLINLTSSACIDWNHY